MLQSDEHSAPDLSLVIGHYIDSQVSIIRTADNGCELSMLGIPEKCVEIVKNGCQDSSRMHATTLASIRFQIRIGFVDFMFTDVRISSLLKVVFLARDKSV